jgi:hypothetical protein
MFNFLKFKLKKIKINISSNLKKVRTRKKFKTKTH